MRFDYVSSRMAPKGVKAISGQRFVKLLEVIKFEMEHLDVHSGFHVSDLGEDSKRFMTLSQPSGPHRAHRPRWAGRGLLRKANAGPEDAASQHDEVAAFLNCDEDGGGIEGKEVADVNSDGCNVADAGIGGHSRGMDGKSVAPLVEQSPKSTKPGPYNHVFTETSESQTARRGLFVDSLVKYNDIITVWKGYSDSTLARQEAQELANLKEAARALEQRKAARKVQTGSFSDDGAKNHGDKGSGSGMDKSKVTRRGGGKHHPATSKGHHDKAQHGTTHKDKQPSGMVPMVAEEHEKEKKPAASKPAEPSLDYVRGYVTLLKLESLLCCKYISSDQAAILLKLFPKDDHLWVMVMTTLFSRLVDVGEIHCMLDLMDPGDLRCSTSCVWGGHEGGCAGSDPMMLILLESNGGYITLQLHPNQKSRPPFRECYHRVGWLNLVNPVYPERKYELDLAQWDHRECCKILCELAMAEDGENWVDEFYRRQKDMDWVPGWEFPEGFNKPDHDEHGKEQGIYREGDLLCRYVSPKVNMDTRVYLKKRVLAGSLRSYEH